jgi:AraC-like DNA-binding protein
MKKDIQTELLYWCHDTNYSEKQKEHSHAFWQMEIFIKGKHKIISDSKKLESATPGILVLPPFTKHKIIYPPPPQESYSFKFTANIPDIPQTPILTPEDQFITFFRESLQKLSPPENNTGIPAGLRKKATEYLLSDILRYISPEPSAGNRAEPDFVSNTKEIVYTYGAEANVSFIAEKLGWSTGYLKHIFKRELNMSIKKFIDREMAGIIKKYLLYSDRNITETASLCHFPDVYSLSRFFKRVTGKTPSGYKKKRD